MKWYLTVVRDNYANFKGRASRKEYWMFVLFNLIFSYSLTGIGYFTELTILGNIYSLAVLIPGLAVTVRRLHDTGKSGWFYVGFFLIIVLAVFAGIFSVIDVTSFDISNLDYEQLAVGFAPYMGVIMVTSLLFLFLMVKDSDEETNKYGPNPKNPDSDELEAQLYE